MLIRATYEGPTFTFEAYGTDEGKARAALVDGLKKHGKQYSLLRDWYEVEDINVYAIKTGVCLRDREAF